MHVFHWSLESLWGWVSFYVPFCGVLACNTARYRTCEEWVAVAYSKLAKSYSQMQPTMDQSTSCRIEWILSNVGANFQRSLVVTHGFRILVSPFMLMWTLDSLWTTHEPHSEFVFVVNYICTEKPLKGSKQCIMCVLLFFVSGRTDTANADTDELNKTLKDSVILVGQTAAETCLRLGPLQGKNQPCLTEKSVTSLLCCVVFNQVTLFCARKMMRTAELHGFTNIFSYQMYQSISHSLALTLSQL